MSGAGRVTRAKRPFELLPCRMPGIEAVCADTARSFGRHTHGQFGLGLIARGAQKSASGRGMVEAGAGDLITVNPGEVHDGMPLDANGRAWRMLYLDPALVAGLVADIAGGWHASVFEFTRPALRDPRLAAGFQTLFAALTAPGADADELAAEQGLMLLLRDLLQAKVPDTRGVPAGIAAARARMDDDPAATPALAELAREAGLGRYQFLRGFARATGLTPHAYLVQRRLQRARRLIGHGLPLADASAACGFADQSHMTRAFVRSFGLTPGAYARSAG
ncbi:AraC family transcriptional regulator [Pseudacidovorax intermedius]|uniref:AraC family transcriptional regulator n=2 Tax=Pseudacidovorax intermedius TaxID=433924 RepID=A0A147GQX1_9BURK|nr:AraC family transcriptional regulator [Pseudacidovorax intermedius]